MGTRHRGTKEETLALNTYIKLMRAADTITSRVHRHILEEKLTPSQFGVLEALFHLGPMVQRDLASKLLVTGGNITMVVDNLEKRRLVRRERDESDRRFVNVYLTDEGLELIRQLFPHHAKEIAAEMKTLTPDEQDTLGRLCRKLGKKEAQ